MTTAVRQMIKPRLNTLMKIGVCASFRSHCRQKKKVERRFRDNHHQNVELEFSDQNFTSNYSISRPGDFKAGETVRGLHSYKLICENGLQATLQNCMTPFGIKRHLMFNATHERTFAKTTLLENGHQSLMLQEEPNWLVIMPNEYVVLQKADFKDIMKDFMTKQMGKVSNPSILQ